MRIVFQDNETIYNEKLIVAYDDETNQVIPFGEIDDEFTIDGISLYNVKWFETPSQILTENSTILIPNIYRKVRAGMSFETNIEDFGLATNLTDFSEQTMMKARFKADDKAMPWIFVLVDNAHYQKYTVDIQAANKLAFLYTHNHIYKQVVLGTPEKPELHDLIDVLFMIDDKEKRENFILALSYASASNKTLQNLGEQILDTAKSSVHYDLMTQEQQVEAFIKFSKLIASNTTEIVPDTKLDELKSTNAYQSAIGKLTGHGFGISKTQQFNVLQSVGYLGRLESNESIIHNLSDMGAGKTLMTVESIYVMDMLNVDKYRTNHPDEYNEVKGYAQKLKVPNKNLIAPLLSIESSWVDTFKLFYNVTKLDNHNYELSFKMDGVTYYSELHVSGFTVNSNSMTVNATLPKPQSNPEFLIIDEIHQIVDRSLSRRKFFAGNISPSKDYLSFVLSGTLSNLTTPQWFNYVKFMDTKFNQHQLDNDSAQSMHDDINSTLADLRHHVLDSVENIGTAQHRYFEDNNDIENPMHAQNNEKATNQRQLFNYLYSAKLLDISEFNTKKHKLSDNLIKNNYSIKVDDNILSTPNFELFYQLVGASSITAQSTQIAEELFGDQKKQHQATVINVPSSLDSNDINILKTLHKLTADYDVYKSQAIATKINNAILNLNDGLMKKNVYDVIEQAANSNMRFLQYLSGLDVDLLEKLSQSGLINEPKLEETDKFKVLQDILNREPDETFLIVVNDGDAMLKLAKALGVESLTKQQLQHPIDYQSALDAMFEKQNIVIVPQSMIKSSLDLVQANRLIQYQLNTEISDIIQTQNRINRIGQTRETKAYYIATDVLQKNVIDLFLETYKNIRVAHKGIVELFVDMSTQVNVVNDYIGKAMANLDTNTESEPIFDENGQMDMFPETKVGEDIEVSDDGDDEVDSNDEVIDNDEEIENENQLSLFDPTEFTNDHQLIPVGLTQAGDKHARQNSNDESN